LKDAPPKAKDLFNKGFGAMERGKAEQAMDLLAAALAVCPGLLQARKFLRAAEVKIFKDKKGGRLAHIISTATGLPLYLKTMQQVKSGKGTEAIVTAERLLRIDPLNVRFISLFGEAAKVADLPEAGVQTLELARDHYPVDFAILKELGSLYQAVGRNADARACYEKLCELFPKDMSMLKLLKDAMALESMREDGWEATAEKGGTYQDMIRDKEDSQLLEKKGKAVKTSKDVDALIQDTLSKIEGEPANINYYRQVARLYVQKEMFAEAIDALQKAFEISSGDPEVAAAISRTRIQAFDHEIAGLREAGDAAGADAKEAEKAQYAFTDLQERVTRYPNDLALRYDLGVMLFDNDYTNDAVQQFQLAQRSPKHRVKSLYYLALCFKQKQQYDMAAQQLEMASADLGAMDAVKKDIVYELGLIAEATGNREKAAGYFKQIYSVDIGFRDVAAKVEQGYRTSGETK
jgi:tetratricopeptide (TPR) repeat protein